MILVAVGGVLGSLFRYLLNELIGADTTSVLVANLIGVAIAGFAVVYCTHHSDPKLRHFLLPGFCGGLTTFSSAILLTQEAGLGYLMDSLFLSFVVIAITIPLARKVIEKP